MEHYAGIDVSLDTVSVCIVDGTGKVLRGAKVATERDWKDREDRRCWRPGGALRGRQCHPDPAGEGIGAQELGRSVGRTRRSASGRLHSPIDARRLSSRYTVKRPKPSCPRPRSAMAAFGIRHPDALRLT